MKEALQPIRSGSMSEAQRQFNHKNGQQGAASQDQAISELEKSCSFLKVLGSYAKSQQV